MNILVIFTGGTIGCAPPVNGVHGLDSNKKSYYLIDRYIEKHGHGINFETTEPLNILSENITIDTWNTLIDALKEINFDKFDGVVITHGSDTLAYTSSLVSLLLSHVKIPIAFVCANKYLLHKDSNGHKNFEDAMIFITKYKHAGTYVFYSYDLQKTAVYLGNDIKQQQPFTDKFESLRGGQFGEIKSGIFKIEDGEKLPKPTGDNKLKEITKLEGGIAIINPYIGLDYSMFNLSGGKIKKIIHMPYHSFSFCTNASEGNLNSIEDFYNLCKKNNVELCIAPFSSKLLDKNVASYPSVKKLQNLGVRFLADVTVETAYAMLALQAYL